MLSRVLPAARTHFRQPLFLHWIHGNIGKLRMVEDVEHTPFKESRFYLALMGIVFIISNTIALSLCITILFEMMGVGIQRLFYWLGVALFVIVIYPKFQSAKPKSKHLMVFVSVAISIASIATVFLS